MDSSRKYAVIDALDKGDDGLNELENSQESITLMTARNLGIALSGDIFVDNELKIKFSELSAKLDTGGSATGEINSIVDEINKNITDPDPLIGVGAKITELETDNTNLITEITEIESGVSTLVINPGEGITYFETLGRALTTAEKGEYNRLKGLKHGKIQEKSKNENSITGLKTKKHTLEKELKKWKGVRDKYRERRYDEMKIWADGINSFDSTTTTVPDVNVDFSTRSTANSDVNTTFNAGGGPATDFKYEICDDKKNPLTKEGDIYIFKVNDTIIKLKNIKFDGTTGVFDFKNLEIEPPINKTELSLSITAKRENMNGLNFILNKSLRVNLVNYAPMTLASARQIELTNFNTAGANVIGNKLSTTYTTSHEEFEQEMLLDVLKDDNDPRRVEVMKSDDHKKALFDFLRPYATTPWGVSIHTPATFTTFIGANSFAEWFTKDGQERNNDPNNTKNSTSYSAYIAKSYPDQVKTYIKNQFKKAFSDPVACRHLKANLLKFRDQFEQRSTEDDTYDRHMNLHDTDMGNMEFGRTRQLRTKKDRAYLEFFKGQHASYKQDLTLQHKGKPTSIKYEMDLDMQSSQKMFLKIKADNLENVENNTLEIPAGSPTDLIRKVLRNDRIPFGKQRMHIAYGVVRSMITLAEEKGIPLSYNVGNVMHILKMQGEEVILETRNINTTTRKATVTPLFNYNQHFDATKDWDTGGTSLESGIAKMMEHFNNAMNTHHGHYRNAVTTKIFKRDKMDLDLNLRRWRNPFKSLWNAGKKEKRDFSFSTNGTVGVGENQHTVQIEYKRNNDFEIQLSPAIKGHPKPFKGSLNSILNTRVKGKRVFDGMELDIMALVNKNLLEKLDNNPKVEKSVFTARDPETGRLYFYQNKRFSYVERYDTAGSGLLRYDYDKELNTVNGRRTWINIVGAAVTAGGAALLGAGPIAALTAAGFKGAFTSTNVMKFLGALGMASMSTNRIIAAFRQHQINYGTVQGKNNLAAATGAQMCGPKETEAVLKNPVIMGRFFKAMKQRMGAFESTRAFIANVA